MESRVASQKNHSSESADSEFVAQDFQDHKEDHINFMDDQFNEMTAKSDGLASRDDSLKENPANTGFDKKVTKDLP